MNLQWIKKRPVTVLNIAFIFFIVALFSFQLFRPMDVLDDWTISLSQPRSYRVVDGRRMAVYNPGGSLIFESKSTKLINAKGTTSRMIVCEATDTQDEREIQLDTLTAAKSLGVNPPRENAVTVPDVNQFNGLPRICRLVIDITYERVYLWRNHSEHAESEPFLVEEAQLTPQEVQEQIESLNQRIKELERQGKITATPSNGTPTNTTSQINNPPVAENSQPTTPSNEETEQGFVSRTLNGFTNFVSGTANKLLGR